MVARDGNMCAEPVFVNVSGDQESISASLCAWRAGRYVKQGCRTGPPGWESIPELLKRLQIRAL
jgi:hypothetical protein